MQRPAENLEQQLLRQQQVVLQPLVVALLTPRLKVVLLVRQTLTLTDVTLETPRPHLAST